MHAPRPCAAGPPGAPARRPARAVVAISVPQESRATPPNAWAVPNQSAATPIPGPAIEPMEKSPMTIPDSRPRRSSGALWVTQAIEAVQTVLLAAPWRKRAKISTVAFGAIGEQHRRADHDDGGGERDPAAAEARCQRRARERHDRRRRGIDREEDGDAEGVEVEALRVVRQERKHGEEQRRVDEHREPHRDGDPPVVSPRGHARRHDRRATLRLRPDNANQ